MKLISLNICAGEQTESLVKFITESAETADIFCFQEVVKSDDAELIKKHPRVNIFSIIQSALPDFSVSFTPISDARSPIYFQNNVFYCAIGLATFVRKSFLIKNTQEIILCKIPKKAAQEDVRYDLLTIKMLLLKILGEKGVFMVGNVHGIAYPGSKMDTKPRLTQSRNIISALKLFSGPKIVTGDFNLLPNTRSIALLEEAELRNLIKEYGIKTTRGSLVKKLHPEYGLGKNNFQEFADYMFISRDISPRNFLVPDIPVSDHLPLIFEFEFS